MSQRKTLSTGVLVRDAASFNAHIDVVNLDPAVSQTVAVEVLDWGATSAGTNPTPVQVTPSGAVSVSPNTHQSFLALIAQSTTHARALYEVRITVPCDSRLVVNCFALDQHHKIAEGNTVLHDDLVEVSTGNPGAWWANAETYAIGGFAIPSPYQNGIYDWGTLAESKVRLVTHCPADKEFIARCHTLGIRCFPYVTFYVGSVQVTFGNVTSDTYQGVKFADHTDWYERDSSDQPRAWRFGQSTDGVGATYSDPRVVCPNVRAYQDKMVAWVDYLMGLGADGVFVDCLSGRDACWGQQNGIHSHTFPDGPNFPAQTGDPASNQNEAFSLLLKRVRDVIKQRNPEGLILGNSGDPLGLPVDPPVIGKFQQYLASDMIEGYICQPVDVVPGQPPIVVQTTTWQADPNKTWDQLGHDLQAYLNQGKQVLVISDLGSKKGLREDAFLCYASARLAGFIWCGAVGPSMAYPEGGRSMADPAVADLYRLRLGEPLTEELTDVSGIYYRVFERGVVAVNPDQVNARSLTVQSPPIPATRFFDIFPTPGATVEVLTVPPYAGRVYLFGSSTDFGLNRQT